MPMGKIGKLQVSRLICGGNLISGFAHSRDLVLVQPEMDSWASGISGYPWDSVLSFLRHEGIRGEVICQVSPSRFRSCT